MSNAAETSAEESPADLVRRIRDGDEAAEGELVERYRRGLGILIRRASSDPSVADDLHQMTFQIALEKIRRGDLREPARLAGFLSSLARNLVIDHFRRASSHRMPSLDEGTGPEDPSASPLENAMRSEESALVRRILDQLPTERDREVLRRFYLAEENKDAICRDLGLTSLHFNRVLFRARERYRDLYLRRAAAKRPR